MSTVRAKFKVESVLRTASDTGEVTLCAVTGGSEENESFWKYTPAGNLSMHIDNKDAFSQFKPGQEFYVDLTLAEEPVKE